MKIKTKRLLYGLIAILIFFVSVPTNIFADNDDDKFIFEFVDENDKKINFDDEARVIIKKSDDQNIVFFDSDENPYAINNASLILREKDIKYKNYGLTYEDLIDSELIIEISNSIYKLKNAQTYYKFDNQSTQKVTLERTKNIFRGSLYEKNNSLFGPDKKLKSNGEFKIVDGNQTLDNVDVKFENGQFYIELDSKIDYANLKLRYYPDNGSYIYPKNLERNVADFLDNDLNSNNMFLISSFIDPKINYQIYYNDNIVQNSQWTKNKTIKFEIESYTNNVSLYYSDTKFRRDQIEKDGKALDLEVTDENTHYIIKSNITIDEEIKSYSGKRFYLYIISKDESNNELGLKDVSFTLNKIDNTPPTINIGEISKEILKSKDVVINTDDALSGVYKTYVKLGEEGDYTELGRNNRITLNQNTKLFIKSEDKAGNISEEIVSVNNIDSEGPKIKFGDIKYSTWNKEGVVNYAVTDFVGVKNILVSKNKITNNNLQRIISNINRWTQEATEENMKNLDGNLVIRLPEIPGDKIKNYSGNFKIYSSGEYYLYAIDRLDNYSENILNVDKVDGIKPIIENFENNEEAKWSNETYINEFNVKDDHFGSGIKNIYYTLNKTLAGSDTKKEGINEIEYKEEKTVLTINQETLQNIVKQDYYDGEIYIWAIDNTGNISDVKKEHLKLDYSVPHINSAEYRKINNKPSYSEKVLSGNKIYFFKDSIQIDLDILEKGSGLDYLEYRLINQDNEEIKKETIPLNGVSDYKNFFNIDLDKNDSFRGKIKLEIFDKANNSYETTLEYINNRTSEVEIIRDINLELNKPVLDEELSINPNGWTKYNRVLTFREGDITSNGSKSISGISHYEYRLIYKDTSIPTTDWQIVNKNSGEKNILDPSKFINDTLEIDYNVNAILEVRAVLNSGKTSEVNDFEIKIHKIKPSVPKILDEGKENTWTNKDLTLDFAEIPKNEFGPNVNIKYILWNKLTQSEDEVEVTTLDRDNLPVLDSDGEYVIKYWSEDAALNSSDVVIKEYKIDKTAPTDLNILLDEVSILSNSKPLDTFEEFHNTTKRVQLSANADISQLDKIEYQLINSIKDFNESNWKLYDKVIDLSTNQRYYIMMRATDMAGNVTHAHSKGVILDDVQPSGSEDDIAINIIPEESNLNGFYSKDVRTHIKVIDPSYLLDKHNFDHGVYSGLKKVSYRIIVNDGTEVVTQEDTLYEADNNTIKNKDDLLKVWEGYITIDAQVNNSNNVIVEVRAEDNSGNVRVSRTNQGLIKIDTTRPVINISYDNNIPDSGKYYNANRTATISITERNFNPSDVQLSITNDLGYVPAITEWRTTQGTGNGDDTVHTATINYADDGEYNFDIKYTDIAGNSDTGEIFADGTQNPKNFIIDKTNPVIEVSFDNNNYQNGNYYNNSRTATISINERNFNPDRVKLNINAVDYNGNNIATNIQSWKREGTNNIATINFVEDGIYSFNISASDMAGNESNSIAVDQFHIDRTDPELSIEGVVDKSANNGPIAPIIKYFDNNFDSSTVNIYLTGVNRGRVELLGVYEDINNGQIFYMNDFENKKEIDDIYTLYAEIIDKAGNKTVKEITFSINRFGSTYFINNESNINGKILKEVDDIVIREVNPNILQSYEIILYKDNETINLKENTDYKVDITGGENNWYEYVFTIFKDNFIDNAVYRIVLRSTDLAGNISENTLESKDASFSFGIDKIDPTINIINVEDDVTYALEQLESQFTIRDNFQISEVKVYLDDNLKKTFTYEDINEIIDANQNFTYLIDGDSTSAHTLKIVAEDIAGNISTEAVKDFYVTTNLWIRFVNNTKLFYSTISLLLLLISMSIFIMVKRRNKEYGKTAAIK